MQWLLLLAALLAQPAAATTDLSPRGGATTRTPYLKKTFSLGSCLQDHLTIMCQLPKIMDAYVGPLNGIPPATNEAIMLAVNSVNNCPFCTSLHGELGRMAGVSADALPKDNMVEFARVFAESNGRGEAVEKAYDKLVGQVGRGKASSVRALTWFLHWGSVSGNTLNALFKGRLSGSPKCGSNVLFELCFAVYYTSCFLLVHLTSTLLKVFPRSPGVVNMLLGAVLTLVAGSFIIPVGMCGLITAPFRRGIVPLL